MREDAFNCVTQKPLKAGNYTVIIEGVKSAIAMHMTFDGQEWDWDDMDRRLEALDRERSQVFWI